MILLLLHIPNKYIVFGINDSETQVEKNKFVISTSNIKSELTLISTHVKICFVIQKNLN